MVLELLYFDGCPSWHQALENLRQALTLHGLDMEVSLIEVKDQANADELRFQGPPDPPGLRQRPVSRGRGLVWVQLSAVPDGGGAKGLAYNADDPGAPASAGELSGGRD